MDKHKRKLAVIQLATGPNLSGNLFEVDRQVAKAAAEGAALVVLPENFAFMGAQDQDILDIAETPGEGRLQEFLARLAVKYGIWIVGGTIPLVTESADKVRAACLVYDDQGEVRGRYDKIHLFDVDLPDGRERHLESMVFASGDQVCVVDSPLGRLGIAICYDLRFPELFRILVDQGMELLALPAAFTSQTGRCHWETLVRARAVENLIYVAASAQGGFHVSGRETYGHSMIVDPWGTILSQVSRGSGYALANMDPAFQKRIRDSFPALQHRRFRCQKLSSE
jgi:predicted amidohydrolase